MKKSIAILLMTVALAAHAQERTIGPQIVPSSTAASAQTTSSSAVGTGTSQAGANNAGNAQSLALNSYGSSHEQIVSTPSIQGNGFYGSVSPDSCTTSADGGAAGWLIGASVVMPHDAMECYTLRVFERTMQLAVNFPSAYQVYQWSHPSADEHGHVAAPYKYDGLTKEDGMALASDELCLMNDRIRAVMEKRGLCQNIKDVPTYDHTGWSQEARAFDRKFAQDHPDQQP